MVGILIAGGQLVIGQNSGCHLQLFPPTVGAASGHSLTWGWEHLASGGGGLQAGGKLGHPNPG